MNVNAASLAGLREAIQNRPSRVYGWQNDPLIQCEIAEKVISSQVIAVYVHASQTMATVTQGNQTFPVAHFRVFLEIPPTRANTFEDTITESVELNNWAHQGLTTSTSLKHCFYAFSTSRQSVGCERIPMLTRVTVKDVLDYLFTRMRRQYYTLDTVTGSGCRFWCQTVLKDMASMGCIAADAQSNTELLAQKITQTHPG
ncbi:hypothetical protein CYLTODRAFT_442646, partial [Cylindrobasidium torrendii FP15055 ss-10]